MLKKKEMLSGGKEEKRELNSVKNSRGKRDCW
jgi:hypothetical protein